MDRPMHVLVGSIPQRGHLIPLLRIAQALLERGHTVTLVLSKYLADQTRAGGPLEKDVRGFKILPVNDGGTEKIEEMVDEIAQKYKLRTPAAQLTKLQEMLYETAIGLIREFHAREPIDYAIVDFFST